MLEKVEGNVRAKYGGAEGTEGTPPPGRTLYVVEEKEPDLRREMVQLWKLSVFFGSH